MQSLFSKASAARSNAVLREVAEEAGLAEVIEGMPFKAGKEAVLAALAAIEARKAEAPAAPEVEAEAPAAPEVEAEAPAAPEVEAEAPAAPEVEADAPAAPVDTLPSADEIFSMSADECRAVLDRLSRIPEADLTEAEDLAEIRLNAQLRKLSADAETRADAKRGIPDSSLISEGVRKSWEDGEVRAKRLTRNAVEVSAAGAAAIAYPSLHKAFVALGLPESKHIRFRVALKKVGALNFEHNGKVYAFRVLGD